MHEMMSCDDTSIETDSKLNVEWKSGEGREDLTKNSTPEDRSCR